jgi:hypothetical protein
LVVAASDADLQCEAFGAETGDVDIHQSEEAPGYVVGAVEDAEGLVFDDAPEVRNVVGGEVYEVPEGKDGVPGPECVGYGQSAEDVTSGRIRPAVQ